MADMLDMQGADAGCRVITVDILDDDQFRPHMADYLAAAPFPVRIRPTHGRITYAHGDSTDPAVVQRVRDAAEGERPVLVVADSDHSEAHTHRELTLYHDLVTPGSWFVMEDTDGAGPQAAVRRFLTENSEFYVDEQCEKFFMTFNPGGFLRRRVECQPASRCGRRSLTASPPAICR